MVRSLWLIALLVMGLLATGGCGLPLPARSSDTSLVARGGTFSDPKWSPDGQRIALVHLTDEKRIEVWDPAGEKLETIAETSDATSFLVSSPGWHGDQVAYLMYGLRLDTDKLVLSGSGADETVDLRGDAVSTSWSRDGRYAAIHMAEAIYLLDTETWELKPFWTAYSPSDYALSPTGRYIAMVDNRFAVLSVLEVATGRVRELWRVQRPGNGLGNLMWSPDEAYVGVRLVSNKGRKSGYYLLDVKGGSPPYRLTTRTLSDPDWSPDGKRIVYVTVGSPGRNEVRIWELPDDWRERARQAAVGHPEESPAMSDGDPLACTPQEVPSVQAIRTLAVAMSRDAPFEHLTGDALAVAREWHALTENGWPPPEWENFWAARPWFDVVLSGTSPLVIHVRYHDWRREANTGTKRFEVACADGRWKVARTADNDRLWQEAPAGVPGQDGELTEELARTLAWEAFGRRGPWLARVATGAELNDGRLEALRYIAGQTMKYTTPWPGTGERIRLTEQGASSAVGQWLDEEGNPTGESVRFVKADGLWKVENHTINGEWLDMREWKAPLGASLYEVRLFGLELGMSGEEVREWMGPPDRVEDSAEGTVFHYDWRQLRVRFDRAGKVIEMTAQTGATNAGVLVGSPASMVELVYGEAPDYTYVNPEGQYLRFTVVDGRVTGFSVGWTEGASP